MQQECSSGRGHLGSHYNNEEQQKVGSWPTLLPYSQALLMTSQTHTTRHKMAELKAVFSRLSNVDF